MSAQVIPLKDKPSGAVLVAGAGIAGMQSALDLADAGYLVYLVEKDISIGGIMARLDKTFPTNDCSTCMISPKLIEVAANPNIKIISRATVQEVSGEAGDFTVRLKKEPRFIDEDACTGCGDCIEVCPVQISANFNQGLNQRKAIYRHFPQAIPSAFAVDKLGASPCKSACPANISVQGYVALIAQGRYREALALIRRDNPLPAVCGRVCPQPCALACVRGEVDQAIAIRELKRFVTDWEVEQCEMDLPQVKERRTEKVAIVGAGPAGLSAAYYLALEGFGVTIFESLPVAGGMLRVGIPDYRLPPEVLDYEIEYIKKLGVEIKLNTALGRDVALEQLRQEGYAALVMAVGAHKGLRLGVEGESLSGVQSGVEFLRAAALGQAESPGDRVVVVGGGNVAVDAARTALRLGSSEVTILYRRSSEEMPAYAEEVEDALAEGVNIVYLKAPARFLEENGRLSGVETIQMELGKADASGRRRPVPVEGSNRVLPIDGALAAIGQEPDLDFLRIEDDIVVSPRARIITDPVSLQCSLPWVYAGGDVVTGPATAVGAIAHGKTAAEGIRRFLDGEDLNQGRHSSQTLARGETEGVAVQARLRPPHRDPAERRGDFGEVVGPYSEADAQAEAARCLSCGICSECYQCVEVCQAGAIKHDMLPTELELKVGALLLAPGFKPFDARLRAEYGYGRYPNVLTALEFERVLSASGPFGGHVKRPGDGAEPKKVAWIQCVGSRDASLGRDYCSYVCCMYATKQAIIAAEHLPGLESTVFYMDIRAQGKGFDRYYERARDQHGVRYIRSIPSRVIDDPHTGDLEMSYYDARDELVTEKFDMVILSVGLSPHPDAKQLAEAAGVETDRFGFAARAGLNPLETNREGVYVCGVFQAPRDIPDTVMQASGAAAQAGELLAPARGSEVSALEFPPERESEGPESRIGVFVCHCGINIGGVVDVPGAVEYASDLPGVVHAEEFLFTCSTDSQEKMASVIKEQDLNRVVVASCSPRTHEKLFQDTLKRAGLNPYLFEMANIRDQCSWVHQGDHASATLKAEDLIRMSVARSGVLSPLHQFPMSVEQSALVIGGGPAGLTAALSLAEQGFETHLVERSEELGGLAKRLRSTVEGFEVRPWLDELIDQVTHHGLIRVHTDCQIKETRGLVGNFTSRLEGGGKVQEIKHGATVVATGAEEYQPGEYLFGEDERVTTQLSLHEALHDDPAVLEGVERVVMIQCVGSREPEHSYCSRICCTSAVANAIAIKEAKPEAQVSILFRDIRTFSLKELAYQKARDLGVNFIRFDPQSPPQVTPGASGLEVLVYDQILHEWIALSADRLVLSAAVRPNQDAHAFASRLKLPLDADGFFMEAHLKLRPVDFTGAGFFMAGAAHGPKFLEEVISQAKAAAARAAVILSQAEMMVGGEVAVVDAERCVACLTCVRTCPYGVPRINQEGVAYIDPAACQGCGSCASACPRKLIQVQHHTDDQILAKEMAL
ncbi:MAG: FAD-dependent oxidoreductase [Desulfarculaceae bacterium]|nr:FAD-dependent oxidoreductase [Desulfarculaceae bacterium]